MKAQKKKQEKSKGKGTRMSSRHNVRSQGEQKSKVLVNTGKVSKKKKLKRLNYKSEDIEHALKAVQSGVSLRKAARTYNVPVTTLSRRMNNPDATKAKPGPQTVLSKKEEDEIVNWMLYRAQRGMPVTKTELLDSVQNYVTLLKKKTPFIDNRPSRHWYENFMKRHPQLTVRKPQHLSTSRAAVSREDLQAWFTEQENYLKKKNLLDISSSRVFNCDETNIVLCPESEKVITEVGSRSVYKIVDAGKESFTVLFTYAANGVRAPPMLMYSYQGVVPKNIVDSTLKGRGIGISENGWMTTETFYEYVSNVFYLWLVEEKIELPVILYLDNHSSHVNIPLVKFCREKEIELIGLVPNSTHIMQPLDIAYFHPFKVAWKKAVPKWKIQNNVTRIKKTDFPSVLQFALDSMKEQEKNIIAKGFEASGLWPFNPAAVEYDVLAKSKKKKKSLEQPKDSNREDHTEKQKFSKNFEYSLSPGLLLEFKNASSTGLWNGDVERKGLFDYWLQLVKSATGSVIN